MLHGSPSDHARAMREVDPAFRGRRQWRRIYPDLPGHGRTPGSPTVRDMDDYLATVLQFVDVVTQRQRFCIGGISFGAYLALAVARKRRTRLDGLLLSVPEIHHGPTEDRQDEAHRTPSIQTPPDLARGLPAYREDTAWLQSLPFRDVSFDLYRGHPELRVPTLVLLGRQDAPFRSAQYWRLLPQLPRATFAILDGAGHRLWTDRRALARHLVRDWLDRVDGAGARPGRPGAVADGTPGT
jgi:pimeloyl-ACP methyl ester carboxylesterase